MHIQERFLSNCDFLFTAKSPHHEQLIKLINYIYSFSREDADLIYCKFNDATLWSGLSRHKYGKSVVENFLTVFFKEEAFKHSLLFEHLLQNFFALSQANYTTFVVQTYISNFKDQKVLGLVIKFFDELCTTRNGVFVIITTLKSFESVSVLLDLVLLKSEILCKGQYTSTLMEYVFKTFTVYTVHKFVHTKRAFVQGKALKNIIN